MIQKGEFKKIKNNFSNVLKMLMKENSLDNTKLAKKTGINRNTISLYLKNDDKNVKLQHLLTLASFFNVSVSYLVGETETREADDIYIGKELGLNDKGIKNLKEIKSINEKDGNTYSSLVDEVITNTTFYKSLIKNTHLMVDNNLNKQIETELGKPKVLAPDLQGNDYADIFVCQKFLEIYHLYITFQTPCNLSKLQLEKEEVELKKRLRQVQNQLKRYK